MGSIVMKEKKEKAISLRKKGNSYLQISKELNVSKSTLSYWLKDVEISRAAREAINNRAYRKSREALIKRNKQQTVLAAQRAKKIREEARNEVRGLMQNNPLFLSGISLYWAEGYKKGAEGSKWKSVDFANSDPMMISVIMKFFRKDCKITEEKFRAQLIAHNNVNINDAVEYWASITGIRKEKFVKTSLPVKRVSKNSRKRQNLTYGTLHIRINDVGFFYRIIGWIDGLKDVLGP